MYFLALISEKTKLIGCELGSGFEKRILLVTPLNSIAQVVVERGATASLELSSSQELRPGCP